MPGRPPLSDPAARRKHIAITLPPELIARLDAEARRLYESKSEVIRMAVEAWLKRRKA